jgi:hypothetical protein
VKRPPPTIPDADVFDMTEDMQRDILSSFQRVRHSIQNKYPLFPNAWPHTRQGIREFPGYDVFNGLKPEDRYFFFLCALGSAVWFSRATKAIDDAVAGIARPTPPPPAPHRPPQA